MEALLGLWALSMALWLSAIPEPWAQEPLALVLRDEETGKALWCAPVAPQEEFVLEFLHSYDRFPVREHYKILGPGRISFQGLITRSVLNGQGFVAEGVKTNPEGWLQTSSTQMVSEKTEFIMGASQDADHQILVRGEKHLLSRVIPAGAFVVVRAEQGGCEGSMAKR